METKFPCWRPLPPREPLETSLVEWKRVNVRVSKTRGQTLETSLVEWKLLERRAIFGTEHPWKLP